MITRCFLESDYVLRFQDELIYNLCSAIHSLLFSVTIIDPRIEFFRLFHVLKMYANKNVVSSQTET
jgi:hypothetical protein